MHIELTKKLMLWFFVGGGLLIQNCSDHKSKIVVKPGMVISKSAKIEPGVYEWNASENLSEPLLIIEGASIVLDFEEVELKGSNDKLWPNEFYGLAVLIRNSKNVKIQNLKASGYKIALMAINVDSLQLINCDFSYNYRQKLYSTRERESLSDWMSYHQNEEDEWLRYGAGVYLKNCNAPIVKGLKVTQGQNGLMMTNTNKGLFYNNQITFNSGIGIGLYRSNGNKVLHNRLDWNVRGHSPGVYARGQDSAGILCYEQSNNNVFAFNSATHSGDGFFLWAGQTTMDTGKGGCNDNIVYDNDFSYAPTNGVEVTFSSNKVIKNQLIGCKYGVWGGYSYQSLFTNNNIQDCDYGIAVEHGQQNIIAQNYLNNISTGIKIWERDQQPKGWGYAKYRDVSSKAFQVHHNYFEETAIAFAIDQSDSVLVDSTNYLFQSRSMDIQGKGNSNFQFNPQQTSNSAVAESWIEKTSGTRFDELERFKLEEGMDVSIPTQYLKGRNFILVNEWGPYNFGYPSIWLRKIEEDSYTFLLLGPPGNWKITDGEGWEKVNPNRGSFPATIVAKKQKQAKSINLDLQFIGDTLINQFGTVYPKGTPLNFKYQSLILDTDWELKWYHFSDSLSILDLDYFNKQVEKEPLAKSQFEEVAFRWWGSPAKNVEEDYFITIAKSEIEIPPGDYRIYLTSDEGARLYVDGNLIIDNWEPHEPATHEFELNLGGTHEFYLEHYDLKGIATLDLHIEPVGQIK